jgi:hypothetical protein
MQQKEGRDSWAQQYNRHHQRRELTATVAKLGFTKWERAAGAGGAKYEG